MRPREVARWDAARWDAARWDAARWDAALCAPRARESGKGLTELARGAGGSTERGGNKTPGRVGG